jgi:hypothetical protein
MALVQLLHAVTEVSVINGVQVKNKVGRPVGSFSCNGKKHKAEGAKDSPKFNLSEKDIEHAKAHGLKVVLAA